MAFVVQGVLRRLEFLCVVLIDSVVGKMNVHVVYVSLIGSVRFELFCGKSSDAFVVQEYLQRITTGNQHVKSYVKLQVVYKKRVLQVLLCYNSLIKLDFFYIVGQKDALALGHTVRLDYEGKVLLSPLLSLSVLSNCRLPLHEKLLLLIEGLAVVPEVINLQRQDPSPGEEIILLWEQLVQFFEILA